MTIIPRVERAAIKEAVQYFLDAQEHREKGCTFRGGDICVECGASRLTDEDKAEFQKEDEQW